MRKFIDKYHLKAGIAAAIIFPGIFIFSKSDITNLLPRFIFSFISILFLWIVNFSLIDFKEKKQNAVKNIADKIIRILLSSIIAVGFFLFVGFVVDPTESSLSQLKGEQIYSFKAWFYLCLRIVIFNIVVVIIKYLFDTYEEAQLIKIENERLKTENLQALHESLKNQMSPHFLFNSFNTLRSLIKQDTSQSIRFVDELSSVYRYMLSHQNKSLVFLKEEINFLHSYVYLLKIRFGNAIIINIQIDEEVLDNLIPPNTLQLLIENAVKHNSHSIQKPLSIYLFIKNNYLTIENNLQPASKQRNGSNFGLNNINTRYTLQKGNNIIIQQDDSHFRVLLPLN